MTEREKTMGNPDAKTLMDASREAQGGSNFDAMGSVDKILLGTLLRIAQNLDRMLELQIGPDGDGRANKIDQQGVQSLTESQPVELPLLSARSAKLLMRLNINTLGELARFTKDQMFQQRGAGLATVSELSTYLAGYELSFATVRGRI